MNQKKWNSQQEPTVETCLWQFLATINSVTVFDRAPIVQSFSKTIEHAKADDYLTEKQVVERWPAIFTRRWLQERRRLKDGGPSYGMINRRIIYRTSEIIEFIESNFKNVN